jgi:hypothetical protein
MKVRYSAITNTLNVVLKDNTPVHESDGDKPGVIRSQSTRKPEVSNNRLKGR